jgi:hypothetical protein
MRNGCSCAEGDECEYDGAATAADESTAGTEEAGEECVEDCVEATEEDEELLIVELLVV